MNIFYIHGFGSGVGGTTSSVLRAQGFKVFELSWESQDFFDDNINSMVRQFYHVVSSPEPVVFVASSTGALYAEALVDAVPFVSGLVFYNPVTSYTQLEKFLGTNTNFKTGKKFNFSQEVYDSYKCAKVSNVKIIRDVILSEDDELLDPIAARQYYENLSEIHSVSGGHRMTEENSKILCGVIRKQILLYESSNV